MGLHRKINISQKGGGYRNFRMGPSVVYLDDVELIRQTLEKAAVVGLAEAVSMPEGGDEPDPLPVVGISAGDAVADTVDDLREATADELAHLRLAITHPRVAVDLWRILAEVTVPDDDPSAIALAEAIQKYVNERRSRLAGARSQFNAGFASALFCFVAAWILFGFAPNTILFGSCIALTATSAFIVFFILIHQPRKYGSVTVRAMKQSERTGLSVEFRRQIVIGVVGAVIGAILVGLASLWAGVFTK